MLDLDCLACDARCLRSLRYGAKSFLGMLLHAHFVLIRCVLNHYRLDEAGPTQRDGHGHRKCQRLQQKN